MENLSPHESQNIVALSAKKIGAVALKAAHFVRELFIYDPTMGQHDPYYYDGIHRSVDSKRVPVKRNSVHKH